MSRKSWNSFLFWLILCLCAPLLTACELPTAVVAGNSTVAIENTQTSTNTDPQVTNPVCNPLGGGTSIGGEHGLKADLYYLDSSLPHYGQVADYLSNGTKLNATLFFDQVNVPTRPFDAGFVTTQGSVITTPQGNTLYEWFAIDFATILKLANADSIGNKQFALLADDGAVLEQKVNDHWEAVVDNDGTHATMFKVARAPIYMNAESALNLRLRYYQGPRFHIAAVLMWREWPTANGAWLDSADGSAGNDLFFDSTHSPSVSKPAYNGLLARGWKPIPAANFFLANGAPANPCPPDPVTPTDTNTSTSTSTGTSTDTSTATLAITAFDGTTTADSADLIWQTNGAPSDGKIHWGLTESQLDRVEVESGSANTLHQVRVSGLNGATQYFFQAESTDSSGNTVRSIILRKVTK